MKRIILAITFCIIASSARSQTTTLLDHGLNGFGANFSVLQGADFLGSQFKLGFTYKGIIEIAPAYSQRSYESYKEYLGGKDSESVTKSLAVSYWFLDSELSDNIRMRLGLTSGFELSTYDNYKYVEGNTHFVQLEELTKGSLGFNTLLNIDLPKQFKVQPNLSFTYYLGTGEFSDILRGSVDDSYNSSQTSLGINFGKQFGEGTHVFILMSQSFLSKSDENYFQAGAGIAFSL